jgi:hypothetical protein
MFTTYGNFLNTTPNNIAYVHFFPAQLQLSNGKCACSRDKATWLHFSGSLLDRDHTVCNCDHSSLMERDHIVQPEYYSCLHLIPIETLNGNHNSP